MSVHRIYGFVSFVAIAGAALVGMLAPGSAEAHHSPANFDTRKTITVTGAVTRYDWFNPHVYITIEETLDNGQKKEWIVECSAPSMLSRMGWSRETLRIGDVLTIAGSPGKDPASNGLLAGTIKRADSTLMDASSLTKQFAAAADAPKFVAKGFVGTWLGLPNMQLVAQYAFPQASLLTAEGAQILKSYDEKAMSPAANCIGTTAPASMLLPDMKQILIDGDVMTIRGELDGAQRVIHLGQSNHEGAIPSHQGHSIGRWEGRTLVIETTHFAYHGLGNGLGVPSSTDKRLIERLTPSADGTTLTYRYELSDPKYLKSVRTGELKWAYRPDMKFVSEPCNLESARRFTHY